MQGKIQVKVFPLFSNYDTFTKQTQWFYEDYEIMTKCNVMTNNPANEEMILSI